MFLIIIWHYILPHHCYFTYKTEVAAITLTCEQVLQGALVAGREKEGACLEFEYLHRKSRCKMMIGRDDISNDIVTLSTCFSMFVYIRAHFCFVLIGRNLTAQLTGSHKEIGIGIQIPETHCMLSFLSPTRRQRSPESLLSGCSKPS